MQKFRIFQSLKFGGLCSLSFLLRIDVYLRRGYNKQIHIFDQYLDRLVAEVHPMQRQCECPEVA
jgi:hypothetical protein